MIEAAVGLGVIISLFFIEYLSVSSGGIIVPGYIAMYLDRPDIILGTIIVSTIAWAVLQFFKRFSFLYGKRRMVICMLLGFIFGWLSRNLVFLNPTDFDIQIQAFGYIIPGLIANWLDRQGFIRTLSGMFITAFIVRILLIIIYKGDVSFNV